MQTHQQVHEEDGHQKDKDSDHEEGQSTEVKSAVVAVGEGLVEGRHVVQLQHHHRGPHERQPRRGVGASHLQK